MSDSTESGATSAVDESEVEVAVKNDQTSCRDGNTSRAQLTSYLSGWKSWGQSLVTQNMSLDAVSQIANSATNLAIDASSDIYQRISQDVSSVGAQSQGMIRHAADTVVRSIADFEHRTDDYVDLAADKIKSIWGLTTGYGLQYDDEDDASLELADHGQRGPMHSELMRLAADPATFCEVPSSKLLDYDTWQCDLEKRRGEIVDLKKSNAAIKTHYINLVPEQMDADEFWRRFFFHVHLVELQLQHRTRAVKARKSHDRSEAENRVEDSDGRDTEDELSEAAKSLQSKPESERDSNASDEWDCVSDDRQK